MALCIAFFFVIRVSNRLSSCSANHKQRLRHVTSFDQSENRSVLTRTGRHLKDFPDAVKNKTKKKTFTTVQWSKRNSAKQNDII